MRSIQSLRPGSGLASLVRRGGFSCSNSKKGSSCRSSGSSTRIASRPRTSRLAVLAQGDRADRLADFDRIVAAGRLREAMDDATQDVHPPQDPPIDVPERSLAESCLCVDDDAGRPERFAGQR